MYPSVAILAFLAFIIGVVSIFIDPEDFGTKKIRTVLVCVLIAAQLATFVFAVYFGTKERRQAEARMLSDQERIQELTKALRDFRAATDAQLASIAELLQRETERMLEEEPAAAVPVAAEEVVYVYYGKQNDDGTWYERFFNRTSEPVAEAPQIGDMVVATGQVNARAGYIEYSSEQGWRNKSIIGLISPGDRLEVVEVNPILGSYIWIKGRLVE